MQEAGAEGRADGGTDRSTTIGKMIDGYLKSEVEMEDHVIHLIFSANRWEAAYVAVLRISFARGWFTDRSV